MAGKSTLGTTGIHEQHLAKAHIKPSRTRPKQALDHHVRSPGVKMQNFPRIPQFVIWGPQRSNSEFHKKTQDGPMVAKVKTHHSEEFPTSNIFQHN